MTEIDQNDLMSDPSMNDPQQNPNLLEKAGTLIEALPYLQRYAGEVFVVKYGGHAMGDEEMSMRFARDVVLLKAVGIHPVVIHGGGPQIGEMLDRLGVQSEFIDGLRVTTRETANIAEMVLSGAINKNLVAQIARAGGRAVGLSGKDGFMIEAARLSRHKADPESLIERSIDLGFVGEPRHIDRSIIDTASEAGFIPVIAPIGVDEGGETFNINADTVAGAIAAALNAARLFLLTDVRGVLDDKGALLAKLKPNDARKLIVDGVISGGMIPKIETCLHAVERGVGAAVILDGRVPHSILLEIFTRDGVGTLLSLNNGG